MSMAKIIHSFFKQAKYWLWLAAILFLNSGFSQDSDVRYMSLEEALKLGEASGYSLRIAREQLSEAKGQNLQAWSGFLPSVTLSENYVKSTDPVSVFGLKLRQGVFTQADFSISSLNYPQEFENYTSSLQLKQPIVNFDAIFGKSAASMIVKARQQGLERARQAIQFQIKSAYNALILSNESLGAIEEAIESARAHRDNARAAFEEGLVTRADYLAAEVRLSELKEQRIIAENQVQKVSDGLKLLLGMSEEERIIRPSDSLTIPPAPATEPDFQEILADRPDLQALRFQKKAAHRQLWMKRSAWLPRINGFFSREWNGADPFQDDNNNWTVGVQLSWNLFDGLGHWGRARQASAKAHQADIQHRQAKQKAKNEIVEARRKLEAARQRIEVARLAVQQANESLHLVEERFKEGLEKTSDLLDKEAMLTQSRLRFLKAKHDYTVAISELKFALGE